WPLRLLQKWLVSRYDVFLAIGKANEQFYRRRGVSPDRLFHCPYFVDNDRFRADSEQLEGRRSQLRQSWGVSSDALCLLFVGKLIAKKRVIDFLRAGDLAYRGGVPLHLLLVGSGPLENELRSLAATISIPVAFAGFLNQT